MAAGTQTTSRDKVRDYRARQRAKGMRLVQYWVPDTSTPEFKAEALRQSRLIAQSPHEADDQAFIDSIQEFCQPDFDEAP